jgi:hypothetical protein
VSRGSDSLLILLNVISLFSAFTPCIAIVVPTCK